MGKRSCVKFVGLFWAVFALQTAQAQGTGRSIESLEVEIPIPMLQTSVKAVNTELVSFAKRARPTPGTAPLDPNATIQGELDTLMSVLGIVSGGASSLIAGLTGISITDCAQQIKGKDLNTLTCPQFIQELSKCDSLMNVKDLLQAAKKRYKKNKNSKKPCFQ